MAIVECLNHLRRRTIVRRSVFILMVVIASSGRSLAQQPPSAVDWNAFKFLIGEWVGEGTGAPGEGTGGFTFSYDLQNTVLLRENFADYPATKDHPAFRHEDLMVVFQEGGKTRATYFDNEHHVINYSVAVSIDSSSIVFVSDATPSMPRFRLTNTKAGADKIAIIFEIAPPGRSESFSRYIEASARRKK